MTAMFQWDVRAANRNVTNPRHTDTSAMLAGIDGRSRSTSNSQLPTPKKEGWELVIGSWELCDLSVTNGGSLVMNGRSRPVLTLGRLDRHWHCL
jgi:hypothetical protein